MGILRQVLFAASILAAGIGAILECRLGRHGGSYGREIVGSDPLLVGAAALLFILGGRA